MNYKIVDYTGKYGSVMIFSKNKNNYFHRWYPFVEGYSKEFINLILDDVPFNPNICLDPFAGSGTTALELQKNNIKCYSLEVNPFMHKLIKVKLRTDYQYKSYIKHLEDLFDRIDLNEDIPSSETIADKYPKLVENDNVVKWNFDKETFEALISIKHSIEKISDKKYRDLFLIGWANILMDASNLYRNGKCLSYKKNWKDVVINRDAVIKLFKSSVSKITEDINKFRKYKSKSKLLSNVGLVKLGDCRKTIKTIPDDSIDLVITSPPYLNSRDYTDSYIIELRMLELLDKYDTMKDYRSETLRSHVQVNWDEVETYDSQELKKALVELSKYKDQFWNKSLPNMIKGYFQDMEILFSSLRNKVREGGYIYFNVANSAYYGIEIKVNKIIAEIAENNGFKVHEIRLARKIKSSSQQKLTIAYLDESVIVMERQ